MKLLGRHDDKEGESRADGKRSLFRHEVRYAGRAVVVLEALVAGDGVVVVETDVFPVNDASGTPPSTRPFTFSTPEQAWRFVEDALVSLEYLDCTVI